jgi:hypothetical protein
VAVTFGPLGQVPASAILVYLGASAIQLTVSRQVTSFDYLGLPAIFGGVAIVLLLLGCFIFVQVYDGDGARKRKIGSRLATPVQATGAWTLNDSWATNIATLVAVIATVLGVSSAASELFPGADIGKFVVLIDIIGAIATAVPLLFAVLYASWIALRPGMSEEASLWLTATLECKSTACLLEPVRFKPTRHGRRNGATSQGLEKNDRVILGSGSSVVVPGTSKIALAGEATDATLMPGTVVTLRPGTEVRYAPGGQARKLILPTKARLKEAAMITLPRQTVVTPLAAELVEIGELPSAHGFRFLAEAETEVTLPGKITAFVDSHAEADLLAGAAAKIAPEAGVAVIEGAGFAVALPDKTTVTRADRLVEGTIVRPQGVSAKLLQVECDPKDQANEQANPGLGSINYGKGADIRVTSSATLAVLWGATACGATVADSGTQPVRMEAGGTIQIPPESDVRIYGGYVTMPGSSDILLRGDCVLVIESKADALAVKPSAAQVAEGAPGTGSASLGFPVRITAHSGAKISVTGVAHLNLPEAVMVTAPRRRTFSLSPTSSRTPIRVPQGTSTLVGPLWAIIAAAVITTFSVGAQLGVAALLTTYLLGASTLEQSLTWLIAGLIGLFSVWYGVTAIRTLADPQPGSSMSGTAGTSFTL